MFAAWEDFGTPLWEIPTELSRTDPRGGVGAARALARRLLLRGWVVMIEEEPAAGTERELGRDEALAVLETTEAWTSSDRMFSLIATQTGDDVYWLHAARRPHHRVGFN